MHFSVDTWLAVGGITLGVLALAVAIPPFIQMIWGRPELEFTVDEFTGPDGKALLIEMKNRPTKKGFLRKIGVVREIGEVMASFDIQEQGTNRYIIKDASGQMNCTPTREQALLVRAIPGFTVGFPVIHFMNGKALIIDARYLDDLKPVDPGEYTVYATIFCAEQIHMVRRNLKIGDAPEKTFWI